MVDLREHVRYPSFSSDEPSSFVNSFVAAGPNGVWITHETGLEILVAGAALVSAGTALYHLYEAIRTQVAQNAGRQQTDRHFQDVHKLRVEKRSFGADGQLRQEIIICQSIRKPLDPDSITRILE